MFNNWNSYHTSEESQWKAKNMKMAGLLTFLSSVGQMNQQTAVVVHPRVLHAHSQL